MYKLWPRQIWIDAHMCIHRIEIVTTMSRSSQVGSTKMFLFNRSVASVAAHASFYLVKLQILEDTFSHDVTQIQ